MQAAVEGHLKSICLTCSSCGPIVPREGGPCIPADCCDAGGRRSTPNANAYMQARLESEAEAAAAAEERLAQVVAAMERCQASATDLDQLADAYGDLQVDCGIHSMIALASCSLRVHVVTCIELC